MMLRWSVVATVKEDLDTVKEFVAHHKSIGASEIHLFFDDPNDPALPVVAPVSGVYATPCGDEHWQGQRPETHQARQKHNANLAYSRTEADWIIHIDADELLYAETPIAAILAETDPDTEILRVMPAEALASDEPDGARMFRTALPSNAQGQRVGQAVYGEIYPLLESGLLSHTSGKYFVRAGLVDVALSIHAPFRAGGRSRSPKMPGALLLHMHGGDEARWIADVRRRLTTGAYQAKFVDERRNAGTVNGLGRNAYLNRLIETEGEAGLRRFWRQACQYDRSKRPLRRVNALLRVQLDLPRKVTDCFGA